MGYSLSNIEIDNHFRKGPYAALYGGTFSKDRLPKGGPAGKCYIINIQSFDQGDRAGSHWVALCDVAIPDSNRDACIYYDPYSVAVPPLVLDFMSKSKLPTVRTVDEHQPIDSTACGWYCIRVLEGILSSTPYDEIFDGILRDEDYIYNEKSVRKLKLRK